MAGAHKKFYRIQHPEIYLLDLKVQYHKIKLTLDMVNMYFCTSASLITGVLLKNVWWSLFSGWMPSIWIIFKRLDRHLKRVHPKITKDQLKDFPAPNAEERNIKQQSSKDRHMRKASYRRLI